MRILLMISMMLLATSCSKDNISLDDDTKKASYALGQQIGRSLKAQETDVNVDVIAMSIRDVIDGKDSRLDDKALQDAMRKMREKVMSQRAKKAEANKKTGDDFLAANKGKEGIQVTESGLQYKVEKAGEGKKPKDTDVVKVHYKGTLTDGTEFDSSFKRNRPAEFPVKGVIKGWTEALQMMPVGSKWTLYVPSELAYGARGRPSIPAHSVLVFDVELLEIVKKK